MLQSRLGKWNYIKYRIGDKRSQAFFYGKKVTVTFTPLAATKSDSHLKRGDFSGYLLCFEKRFKDVVIRF